MLKSIRTKLLILMVVANALMVIGMLSLNSIQFSHGFSDYIIQQETRRLRPLVENIAKEYEEEQNWDWVQWHNPKWQKILHLSFAPPDIRGVDRPEPKRPPTGARNFFEHLSIKDAKTGEILLGHKASDKKRIWLSVNNAKGDTLAYVGFAPSSRANREFDSVFRQKQQRGLIVIGFMAILIAAALAVPFSAWLVRPIRKLSDAVRQMARGNLAVSVEEDRNDELGQLAHDFNRLAKILEKNLQNRQQWVSDIAHELRTPVAIFLADIEAVQDGVRKVDAAWLINLHDQVERLSRLVNDLHQLSQSDAGTLNYRFETLDLASVIKASFERLQRSCREKNIKSRCDMPSEPVLIRGDDTRLSQLLNNLIQNTLRYTDSSPSQPGQLQIALTKDSRNATLVWQDSAPGVDDTDLDKLFDRLYRVDHSRSRESGGSGLGLAIVQNIVEAHEGRIQAGHSDSGGVKLTITLPLDNT